MSEGSVSPKERVNIVYKPAAGDVQESVELPFKTLILGDFSNAPDSRRVEEREPINIDKDNFNEVLKSQDIKLDIQVPNKLSKDPEAGMSVSLDFKTMKDFGPEAVSEKVPELKKLLELREALASLKGPLSNLPKFRRKIQELINDEDKRRRLFEELGISDSEGE